MSGIEPLTCRLQDDGVSLAFDPFRIGSAAYAEVAATSDCLTDIGTGPEIFGDGSGFVNTSTSITSP